MLSVGVVTGWINAKCSRFRRIHEWMHLKPIEHVRKILFFRIILRLTEKVDFGCRQLSRKNPWEIRFRFRVRRTFAMEVIAQIKKAHLFFISLSSLFREASSAICWGDCIAPGPAITTPGIEEPVVGVRIWYIWLSPPKLKPSFNTIKLIAVLTLDKEVTRLI